MVVRVSMFFCESKKCEPSRASGNSAASRKACYLYFSPKECYDKLNQIILGGFSMLRKIAKKSPDLKIKTLRTTLFVAALLFCSCNGWAGGKKDSKSNPKNEQSWEAVNPTENKIKFSKKTAEEITGEMALCAGWNLGNTLDATGGGFGLATETSW